MRELEIAAAAALLIGVWAAALVILFCGETAGATMTRLIARPFLLNAHVVA